MQQGIEWPKQIWVCVGRGTKMQDAVLEHLKRFAQPTAASTSEITTLWRFTNMYIIIIIIIIWQAKTPGGYKITTLNYKMCLVVNPTLTGRRK